MGRVIPGEYAPSPEPKLLAMPMRSYSRERDERRVIIILYFGALVIMSFLLYATYVNMRRANETTAHVRRYNVALVRLGDMVVALREEESAVQGSLLTGDTLSLGALVQERERSRSPRMGLDSLLTEASWRPQLTALYHSEDRVRQCLSDLLQVQRRSNGRREDVLPALAREQAAMESFKINHTRVAGSIRSFRRPMVVEQQEDGSSTPIMLVLYAALAVAATALLFWRVSHALSNTERAKRDLHLKVNELDAEVERRASVQKLLQRVLDTSPNGIMTFRAMRDEQGRIADFTFLSSNRPANDMFGREDLVGLRMLQELPQSWAACLFDEYVAVVETGNRFQKDVQSTGIGTNAWFTAHAVRLGDGFMVTLTDITEQRRAQEVNAEAERIALTGQITRTVAHEVRNPLTNIQLATEQLFDEVADREELVRPFFAIIDRNVKRIAGLVNGMLESSRKRQLNLVPCRLEEIVDSAMKQVKDRMELKHVVGIMKIADHLPEVMADPELLNLAISNITVNAVEAMGEGRGVLRMEVHAAGDELLLEISDTGKGIPPEQLGRLFEPFYTARPGGLGLGLTTTRSILNSHQIKLEVRSIMGQGTTFTLRFPRAVFATPHGAGEQ
jgi:signal transduction histidine kinase